MITIPIDLEADKLSRFLDFLRAEINANGTWRGEGSFQTDGSFEERTFWTVSEPSHISTQIVLTATWRPDGTLEPITASIDGPPTEDWEKFVEATIRQALISTLKTKLKRFFWRHTFAYLGPPLDGEYFISGFRIAPAIHPDDPAPLQERVLYIRGYPDLSSPDLQRQEGEGLAVLMPQSRIHLFMQAFAA